MRNCILCSENTGTNQLRGNSAADQCPCFLHMEKHVFFGVRSVSLLTLSYI